MGASTMEKIRMTKILGFGLLILMFGCSSKFLKHDNEDQLKKIDEFDKKVKIEMEDEPAPVPAAAASESKNEPRPVMTEGTIAVAGKPVKGTVNAKADAKPIKVKKEKQKKEFVKADSKKSGKPARRQPELESDLGFDGRRPIKDPFRIGEKVVHAVNYYKVSAGTMTLEVKPFAKVDGKKSYHFEMTAKTSDWYSGIFSVEDKAKILMDYETMVPSVYILNVKESSQLKEARMLFENNKATYWEKRVTSKSGVEEKKQAWDLEEYTQSLYSAVFYMRAFQWEVGKEIAFRVADDNDNMIFKGQALRKERLKTKAGEFDAIVVKPQVELKGKFKQAGDIFIWLSDDDRKYILRIEAKIQIGSLVSEITELSPGSPN